MKAKMSTKIGTFEFEGDDDAVQAQVSNLIASISAVGKEYCCSNNTAKTPKTAQSNRKKNALQPKNLPDLLSVDDITKLKEYMAEKKPISHMEKCMVFTLWLREKKNVSDVSQDEMWTLYMAMHIKPPMNLIQVFRDGKAKRGFFDLSPDEQGRYFITSLGETHVKFDLPKMEENNDNKQ